MKPIPAFTDICDWLANRGTYTSYFSGRRTTQNTVNVLPNTHNPDHWTERISVRHRFYAKWRTRFIEFQKQA